MRPCVPHRRMCSTLGPGQVFFDSDLNRRRGLYIQAVLPKMPGASSFSKTGRYRVPSTLVRRQQFSWRRNQPELVPRGLRTAVATTTSRPPSSRTEVSAPEGARQIQQGPQPKELPRLRHWSIVGSVGPLHGPGLQRSHASAGQPGRIEGEDQLGPTASHILALLKNSREAGNLLRGNDALHAMLGARTRIRMQ
jgi:hypothetical protein